MVRRGTDGLDGSCRGELMRRPLEDVADGTSGSSEVKEVEAWEVCGPGCGDGAEGQEGVDDGERGEGSSAAAEGRVERRYLAPVGDKEGDIGIGGWGGGEGRRGIAAGKGEEEGGPESEGVEEGGMGKGGEKNRVEGVEAGLGEEVVGVESSRSAGGKAARAEEGEEAGEELRIAVNERDGSSSVAVGGRGE